MRTAKVYSSVMGDAKTEALTLKGLESARGFLQSKIADRLQTRQTPILTFVIDQGVKNSIATSRALRDTLNSTDEVSAEDDLDAEDDATDATALDEEE
jgi:ribosome-binding factor A